MSSVDAHVHVWSDEIAHLDWLAATDLPSAVRVDDLAVGGVELVLVTADPARGQAGREARALSGMTSRADVLGFVGGIDLTADDAGAGELSALLGLPGLVGVRHNLQDLLAGLDHERLVAGWRLLADAGVPFDACVRWHELDLLADLLDRVPELVVVLDHLGKPPVGGAVPGAMPAWRAAIRRLASRPRTWCKLSGLAAECPDPGLLAEATRACVGFVLDAFGAERCLLGSDRPITDDPGWTERVLALVPPEQHERVTGGVAREVYGPLAKQEAIR